MKAHIQAMHEKRDELVRQTQPPPALFGHVTEEEIRLGAGLNQAFAAALNIHKKKSKRQPPLTAPARPPKITWPTSRPAGGVAFCGRRC